MAEALLNYWGKERFQAFSAGSQPTGIVNPLALETLKRNGIFTDTPPRSKSWNVFAQAGATHFDFIFTVCDNAANETCPVWPGAPMTAHWGVADPAAVEGSQLDKLNAFRVAFRELENRIKIFVNLPLESLDKLRLQRELDRIGQVGVEVGENEVP